MKVPAEKSGKRPVVSNNQVVTPTQKGSVADDHEASGSKSHPECFLPRWCPPGLTHTQRRKLQRLRLREKREKELEKKRTKILSYGPPWAHYLGGYQDRLLGGPLGLPGLRCTAPGGVKHKDYRGEVLS
jgi:hypothetical protein